jgi:hypothetical protein
MPRRLRLFVVNNDPDIQQHYVQKSTINLIPPEKIDLYLHEMQMDSSIHATSRQLLPDSNQICSIKSTSVQFPPSQAVFP